jgi:hypothetical protein
MAMNPRLGGPTWLIPAGLLALVGAGAVALWRGPRSAPKLDEICALARQHQFDRAEDLMTRYLRVFPGDNRAHLLLAQFAMDRSDPQPQRALDHLGEIQSRTFREAAVVRFSEGKAHYQQTSSRSGSRIPGTFSWEWPWDWLWFTTASPRRESRCFALSCSSIPTRPRPGTAG